MTEWVELVSQFIDPRTATMCFVGGYFMLYLFSSNSEWWQESKTEERLILGIVVGIAYLFFAFTPIYASIGFWLSKINYEVERILPYYLSLGSAFVGAAYLVGLLRRSASSEKSLKQRVSMIFESLGGEIFPLYDFLLVVLVICVLCVVYPTGEAMQTWLSFLELMVIVSVFFWAMPILFSWPFLPSEYRRHMMRFLRDNPWQRYRTWSKTCVKERKLWLWVFLTILVLLDARALPLFSPRVVALPEEFNTNMVTLVIRGGDNPEIPGYTHFHKTYVISRPLLGMLSTNMIRVPSPRNLSAEIALVDSNKAKIDVMDNIMQIVYPRTLVDDWDTRPLKVKVDYMNEIVLREFSVFEARRIPLNQTTFEVVYVLQNKDTILKLRARDIASFYLAKVPSKGKVIRILFDGVEGKSNLTEYSNIWKAYQVREDGRIFITFGDLDPGKQMNVTIQYSMR